MKRQIMERWIGFGKQDKCVPKREVLSVTGIATNFYDHAAKARKRDSLAERRADSVCDPKQDVNFQLTSDAKRNF